MPYKAFGGKLEEFRNGLDIPIGVPDINMAQISGKLRQFPPHIEARPVPFDEPTSRETVTKILKPRSTAGAPTASRRPQADGAGHHGERAAGYTAMHSLAAFGNEERLRCGSRPEFIALFCVAREGSACRVLDRNETGLAEL
jgi:hypothetical protein